jgi:hypothetical protein
MNTQELVAGLLRGDFSNLVAIPSDRRSEERRTLCDYTPARIVLEGSLPIKAVIVNVCESGLGMHSAERIMQGVKATVEISDLIVSGSINYCVESVAGAVFIVGFQAQSVRRDLLGSTLSPVLQSKKPLAGPRKRKTPVSAAF